MSRARDLGAAREAALAGGAELVARYRSEGVRDRAETKSTRRDLVTDADRAAEAAVLGRLRAEFPGDAIVSEESAADPQRGARRAWIVDPLDGTVNFAHGIPLFSVSVALVEDGRPVVGVVHAPLLGETFEGVPGDGASRNGTPIRVSATSDLADALLATGFAYDLENLPDDNLDNLARVAKRARGVRRLGSAALDLAWVAAGRLDGFWELHLSPWDVAAGAALVAAAGGRVTDFAGGGDWLHGRHVAATNGAFHAALLASLARPSFARNSKPTGQREVP
jgi:myo-inositol-1(or 4)-monophosphatase